MMLQIVNIASIVLAAAASDGVELSATLSPPAIPFHRTSTFTVAVEAPASVEIDLPVFEKKLGELDTYGEPETKTETLENGRVRKSVVYVLDPVFPGDYVLEPVTVELPYGQQLVTPAMVLAVRELTPEEEAAAQHFAAYAGPIDLPPPIWRRWPFWAAAATLAILVCALAAYVLWRRRRVKEHAVAPVIPWEAAFARLDALEQRGWHRSGQYGPFYVELSAILREYIEGRFQLHAPERTTPEFLLEASRSGLFSEDRQRVLARFLRQADMVKFAKYVATTEQMEADFQEARRFIEQTRPVEASTEEAAA